MKTSQRSRDLKAVVEPVSHHQVATLSGQDSAGPDFICNIRSRGTQRMKDFGHSIAYLRFGNYRHIVSGDVNTIDPAERLHLANKGLVQGVSPYKAHAAQTRGFRCSTAHQMTGHGDYRG